MNTRTSPNHAHQSEAWHQCWDEYNRLNAEIRDFQVQRSDAPSLRDHFAREIKSRREKQRRVVAKSQTLFTAPQQLAA